MTEPSVYAEDVSKLKDADELKQACIGLKDTNRYFVTAGTPPSLQVFTLNSLQAPTPSSMFCPSYVTKLITMTCKKCVFVNTALSCADLLGSCVSRWKSVIS